MCLELLDDLYLCDECLNQITKIECLGEWKDKEESATSYAAEKYSIILCHHSEESYSITKN